MRKNMKRIFAVIGAIILIGMYAATLIFALLKSDMAFAFFKGAIACTILIPILLYVYILFYRLLNKRK